MIGCGTIYKIYDFQQIHKLVWSNKKTIFLIAMKLKHG